jgi:hypothetical protein
VRVQAGAVAQCVRQGQRSSINRRAR